LGKALAAIIAGLASLAFIFSIIIGYTFVRDGSKIIYDKGIITPALMISSLIIAPLLIILSTLMIVAVSSYVAGVREAYMSNFVIFGLLL
jgi:hypothetical protein